jgi:hypothetical protein
MDKFRKTNPKRYSFLFLCLIVIILPTCLPKTIEQQVEKLMQTNNLSDKIR